MTLASIRCAASAAPQDDRCSHCGSHLATVACPNGFALVATTAGHCGHCGSSVALEPEEPAGPSQNRTWADRPGPMPEMWRRLDGPTFT